MKFNALPLKGAYTIDLDKREDERGFFARYWCKEEFSKMGLDLTIAQINNSMSRQRGTLRGLHFQRPPKSETKIVRCIYGAIWDVIVDIRANSPTFGKWYSKELNENNRTMMYIPKGFAHGYLTLSDNAIVNYKVDNYYNKDSEHGINYNDSSLDIKWMLNKSQIIINQKDLIYPEFK